MSRRAEVRAGWRPVTLGDLCRIEARQVDPRQGDFAGLPLVSGENLVSGIPKLRDVKSAAEGGVISSKYLFEPGDVLYSKLRPYLRKVVVAPCTGLCSADMYPLKPVRDIVEPDFLAWLLLSEEFTAYASGESRRARMPKLNRAQLFSWPCAVPAIDVQRTICETLNKSLSSAERARAAAEEQISLASCLAQALISEQFESAAVKGWPRRRLGSLAETCSGLTPNRGRPDYFGGQIPWVKTGELLDGTIFNTDEFVTEVAVRECGLRVLPPGTLLVAMYGQGKTRGRTGLLGCAATTNQACFAVLPNPVEFDSAFLQLWFRHKYQELRDLTEGRGGSQPNLNGEILRTLEVPLPAPPEQLRVVRDTEAGLGHVVTVRRVVKEQMDSIAALPAALLRQAFRGEL